MLLLSHRYLTNDQRSFAYPPHEAVKLVSRALANGQDINGLNDLRAWLPINRDSEILEQIKKGQWVLLRRGARAFRWADFAESVQEQRAIYDEYYAPRPEPKFSLHYILVDSSGAPVVDREYHMSTPDFRRFESGKSDTNGHTGSISSPTCEETLLRVRLQTRLAIA